VGQSGPSRV